MPYRLLRSVLFLLPAEAAHRFAVALLRALGRRPRLRERLRRRIVPSLPELGATRFGLAFDNPIGLAAGFDKDARAVGGLFALGFGFVEVGTVTPRPQPGNPRPRLFRAPGEGALVNRMGFNNAGAARAVENLAACWRPGPIGINLGKNKDTPEERSADDYVAAIAVAAPAADYLAVNVSSPNTPGLRRLQELDRLVPLLERLREANDSGRRRPLLLKVSPDVSNADLEGIVDAALAAGIDGLIATNTTVSRPRDDLRVYREAGGLSGAPLAGRAAECLRVVRQRAGARLPVIAVGGIASADDVFDRLRAGACLVQLFTGFVYQGPGLVGRLCLGLAERLRKGGFRTLDELVGSEKS